MSRGKKCFYPRKRQMPLSFNLTVPGFEIMEATLERTGRSRSDVIEFMFRNFGDRVEFPKDQSVAEVTPLPAHV